jgi:hypothetical protein
MMNKDTRVVYGCVGVGVGGEGAPRRGKKRDKVEREKEWDKKKNRANVTHDSRLVTHGSTKRAQTRLTSVIGREPVHSRWYERWRR